MTRLTSEPTCARERQHLIPRTQRTAVGRRYGFGATESALSRQLGPAEAGAEGKWAGPLCMGSPLARRFTSHRTLLYDIT